MNKELVIATRNKKKFKEIERLFKDSNIKILSLDSFPDVPEVVEDKDTFQGNAIKKALVVSSHIKRLVLADDSGLEVDSLDGEPGVYSSRYAGPSKSDKENNAKLLRKLADKSPDKRRARFRCVIAIADKGKLIKTVEGTCEGIIGDKEEGVSGFGYDPLFIPEGYKESFAILGPEVKDKLSHRGEALKKAREFIQGDL